MVSGTVQYRDIEPILGIVLSSKMATLYELSSSYSLDDCYILYDVIQTDNYNKSKIAENVKRDNEQKTQRR